MPHECTDCGRSFDDGSKEMLSGCPDCGGTTFQFRPPGESAEQTETADPPEPPEPAVDGVTRTVGTAASAVRNLVTGGDDPGTGAGSPDGAGDHSGAVTADEGGTPTATADTSGAVTTGDTSGGASDDEAPVEPASGGDVGSTGEGETGIITAESDPSVYGERSQDAPADETDSEVTDDDDAATASSTPEDAAGDGARSDPSGRPPVPDPRPISARPGAEETAEESEPPASDQGVEVDIDAATGGTTAETRAEVGAADDADDVDDTSESEVPGHEDGERPTLSQLREELNDQFESIRVVEPGQYELNLMELYDREEYIVALQEDGRYTIQLPERWEDG